MKINDESQCPGCDRKDGIAFKLVSERIFCTNCGYSADTEADWPERANLGELEGDMEDEVEVGDGAKWIAHALASLGGLAVVGLISGLAAWVWSLALSGICGW